MSAIWLPVRVAPGSRDSPGHGGTARSCASRRRARPASTSSAPAVVETRRPWWADAVDGLEYSDSRALYRPSTTAWTFLARAWSGAPPGSTAARLVRPGGAGPGGGRYLRELHRPGARELCGDTELTGVLSGSSSSRPAPCAWNVHRRQRDQAIFCSVPRRAGGASGAARRFGAEPPPPTPRCVRPSRPLPGRRVRRAPSSAALRASPRAYVSRLGRDGAIHNYGHGGAGYALLRLRRGRRRPRGRLMPGAVLCAGCVFAVVTSGKGSAFLLCRRSRPTRASKCPPLLCARAEAEASERTRQLQPPAPRARPGSRLPVSSVTAPWAVAP
jgi:hypothetical protein